MLISQKPNRLIMTVGFYCLNAPFILILIYIYVCTLLENLGIKIRKRFNNLLVLLR